MSASARVPFRSLRLLLAALLVLACVGVAQAQNTDSPQGTPQPSQAIRQPVAAAPEPEPQQAHNAIPVSVRHTGDDAAGLKMAFHLKERLSQSPLFRLTSQDERKIEIRIISQSEFPGRPHLASAYSVVWVYMESNETLAYFLAQDLGLMVQSEFAADASEEIAARTDKVVSQYSYLFE